jgi:5-methylcytosine-specific restriction endonuclease McrA
MSIYDDTPETAPKTKSQLPSKRDAVRKLRSHSEYKKARDQYLQRAQNHHNPDNTKGEHCWLCGEAIDYRLKFPHPRSWSLDHLIPIADNPRLLLEPNNLRSAHLDCNRHRGTEAPSSELGVPSEIW